MALTIRFLSKTYPNGVCALKNLSLNRSEIPRLNLRASASL
jgi:hypothetical protein